MGASFFFIAGQPLKEPIDYWGGSIVMNMKKELRHVFAEYEANIFIKCAIA